MASVRIGWSGWSLRQLSIAFIRLGNTRRVIGVAFRRGRPLPVFFPTLDIDLAMEAISVLRCSAAGEVDRREAREQPDDSHEGQLWPARPAIVAARVRARTRKVRNIPRPARR